MTNRDKDACVITYVCVCVENEEPQTESLLISCAQGIIFLPPLDHGVLVHLQTSLIHIYGHTEERGSKIPREALENYIYLWHISLFAKKYKPK